MSLNGVDILCQAAGGLAGGHGQGPLRRRGGEAGEDGCAQARESQERRFVPDQTLHVAGAGAGDGQEADAGAGKQEIERQHRGGAPRPGRSGSG